MQNEVNREEPVITVREARQMHIRGIIIDVLVFVSVFFAVILFFKNYQFPSIAGESMSPTLHDSDKVIAQVTSDVNVGDIAVIWSSVLDEYVVKRVVAVGGDHVMIANGKLYRNGERVYEDYIAEQQWGEDGVIYDLDIPAGTVFVLGDNRNGSTDSRVLGVIDCNDIHMKVLRKVG